MVLNRRGLALSAAVVLILSTALGAQKKDDKKQSDAQKKDTLDIVKLADGAAAGQPMTNDFGLAWAKEDYLKATGNKEYVPFTVTFDSSKMTSGAPIAFYWRVVAKDAGATATLTLPVKKDDKDKDKKAAPRFAYEDINFLMPGTMGRLSRAFTGAAEKFFNKTSPQDLNGKTLPAAFDMSLGHQLQTGQAVPLASFPAGDYRLEIKVTDKLATKTVTRDVNFTVTAG